MSDQNSLPISALPDGGAQVHVVLHLPWEDVAALGREAGRLATQLQRPVSLDEAASHKLRTRSVSATPALKERAETATPTTTRMSLTSGSSTDPGPQRTAAATPAPTPAPAPAPTPFTSRTSAEVTAQARGPFDPPAKFPTLTGTSPDTTRATG